MLFNVIFAQAIEKRMRFYSDTIGERIEEITFERFWRQENPNDREVGK